MINSVGKSPKPSLSFVHNADPRIKLVITIAIIITISVITPLQLTRLILPSMFILFFIWISRINLWHLLGRFLLIAPLLILAGISLPFITPGIVGGSIPVLNWAWTVEGWQSFLALLARSSLSLLTLIFFVTTTDFPRIVDGLERLKLPIVLVNSLTMIYRYIFVLSDEGKKMMRARNSRWMGRYLTREPLVLGNMVGTLWIRTYLRSVRIANAMLARGGLTGKMISITQCNISIQEWLVLGLSLGLCLLTILIPQQMSKL